jgi:hypothetical protein
MYLALSYCLGAFTALMALTLLWLGWENNRDQARAAKARREKSSRSKVPS